jgi:hypothetical protein
MSYDQDFNINKKDETHVTNMIRAPRMPETLQNALEGMDIL